MMVSPIWSTNSEFTASRAAFAVLLNGRPLLAVRQFLGLLGEGSGDPELVSLGMVMAPYKVFF